MKYLIVFQKEVLVFKHVRNILTMKQPIYIIGFSLQEEYKTSLLEVNSEGCNILIAYNDEGVHFDDVLDPITSRSIWIENYKTAIELAGGISQLEKVLTEIGNSLVIQEYYESELAALESLNISYPPYYNLLSKDPELVSVLEASRQYTIDGSEEIIFNAFINDALIEDRYARVKWFERSIKDGYVFLLKKEDIWEVIGHSLGINRTDPIQLNVDLDIPLDVANKLLEEE